MMPVRMGVIESVITVNLSTAIDRVLEVPDFRIGGHARVRQISRYPAGKAINVSRALARLGRTSIATGFVGQHEQDHFDRFLRSMSPGRGALPTLVRPRRHP
jgi:fructose-1-phosphate kinase PfkB-like protein